MADLSKKVPFSFFFYIVSVNVLSFFLSCLHLIARRCHPLSTVFILCSHHEISLSLKRKERVDGGDNEAWVAPPHDGVEVRAGKGIKRRKNTYKIIKNKEHYLRKTKLNYEASILA